MPSAGSCGSARCAMRERRLRALPTGWRNWPPAPSRPWLSRWRCRAGRLSMSSSPGASTSLPSIPSSSTASAIASRSPAPKTIGATLRSWRPPLPPTSRPSGGLNPSIPSSWSCGSSPASKTTCRRNSAASPIGCASNCTATTHSFSTSCLRPIHQQRAECATQIEGLLERLGESQEHRDVPILRSVVGVGRVVAATMLAEASRLLAARDYHGLRAQTGVAPITRQSGRRTLVCMRYACNPRLRQAAYHWGQSAARHDPVSRAHYERLRARGHSHARAVRGVVDRLLHVLIAMLTAGTLYDPARRRLPVGEAVA